MNCDRLTIFFGKFHLIKELNFLLHEDAAWSEKTKDVQGLCGDERKG